MSYHTTLDHYVCISIYALNKAQSCHAPTLPPLERSLHRDLLSGGKFPNLIKSLSDKSKHLGRPLPGGDRASKTGPGKFLKGIAW